MNPQKQHTLPEGWEMRRLKDLVNLVNGFAFNPRDWKKEGLPIIRIQNLNDEKADFNYYDGKIEQRYVITKGDLLFAWSGTKGVSFGARVWNGTNAVLNQHIFKVLPKKDVTPNFCFFLLISAQSNIEKNAHGFKSSFVHVTKAELEKITVSLPPLPEQRRIAAVLGTWDTAIEQTTKLLNALRARHRGLMHQLLTGKVRLPGFSGEWKQVKANEIFRNVSIRNRPNEPLLSVTQERGVIPRSMLEGRVTMPESETSSYKLVVPGDFIISLRSFQGGIETSYYQGVVSPAYTVLKPKIDIEDNFYRHYFKSIRFIRQLGVAVIGIRDGKQISFDDFSAIVIPKPSLAEQRAIAQVLDASLKEIQQQEAKLEVLREQKRGLMQRLLTGRVRVPAA